MELYKKIVLILIFVFFIITLLPISNLDADYNGTSEYFILDGKSSYAFFKTDYVHINAKILVFRNVKNIKFKTKGEIVSINRSSIQVEYKENKWQTFSDVDILIGLNATEIKRKNSEFYVKGNKNYFNPCRIKSNNSQVYISNQDIDLLSIKGEDFSDFTTISFELDNASYVDISSELIKIDALQVSELTIGSQLSGLVMRRGEGILRLDDRFYLIKSTDKVNINFDPNYESSILVRENDVEFSGNAKSVSLNEKNKMIGTLFYWFNQQTEKINALFTIILVIITAFYVRHTGKTVEQSENEMKIALIEKRLEKLYYPLKDILESTTLIQIGESINLRSYSQSESNYQIEDLIPYLYLAQSDLEDSLKKFIKILRKHGLPSDMNLDELNDLKKHIMEIITIHIQNLTNELNDLVD